MVDIFILFVIYIIICLVASVIFALALMGLLYCICWIIVFIDEFINNDWKDKND